MKHFETFALAISVFLFSLTGCNNADKQKEQDLKEKEAALNKKEQALKEKELTLDNAKNGNTANQNTKPNMNKENSLKSLTTETRLDNPECGTYNFTITCSAHGWGITIKFSPNSNRVSLNEGGIMSYNGGDPDVAEEKSTGTYKIDKVTSDYKYVTSKFKNKEIFKLKYSIKKYKWYLIGQCDETDEIEGEKNQ